MKKPCHWKLQDALSSLSRAYAGTSFGDDTADWEGGRVMRGTCVLAAFASSLRLVSLLQVCVCCNVPRQGSFPLTLLTGFLIPHFTVSWQHIQNFFSNLMWQTCCQSSDPKKSLRNSMESFRNGLAHLHPRRNQRTGFCGATFWFRLKAASHSV